MSCSPYVSVDLQVKIKGRPRELEKEANVEVLQFLQSPLCVLLGETSKRRVQNQSFQWLTLHWKHCCPSLLETNCEGHSYVCLLSCPLVLLELYVLVSFLFVFMPENVCVLPIKV